MQTVLAAAGSADLVRIAPGSNMPFTPALTGGLFYAEKGAKHLFLNPDIPNWLVVNANAAVLLSRCDGAATAAEIATACGAPVGDVEQLFARAAEHGIITGYPAPATSCRECDKPDTCNHVSSPRPQLRIVHWKLTDSCNLRCRYCYAESGRNTGHLSLAELLRIAHEVAELSPSVECVLSGGEPLLHPDALAFGEAMRAAGNEVSLLTNGTLIDASNAARIASMSNRIKISMDGSTEHIHAMTRGKGNYAVIVAAVDLLIKYGANIQVAMTVHKGNRHDIDAMTKRYGGRLTFQPLFQAGRGADKVEMALTGNEYYDALVSTENVAPMSSIEDVVERLRGKGVTRCALAEAEISISETGDVYPCQLLSSPEFRAGNVRTTPLAEIYYNSPVLLAARNISIDTLAKCQSCPIRRLCAGGCRARDYYEIGTIADVGDFCEYEQQAFLHGLFDSAELLMFLPTPAQN